MRDLLPVLAAIRHSMRFLLQTQRVTVTALNPLNVQLQDGTNVPAVGITGLTYTVGSPAIVLISERGQPIVLPTT